MATNVQQRITGLGRAQLAEVVATLFAELAAHRDHTELSETSKTSETDKQDGGDQN
jgi:hypothetical protein